MHERSKKSTDKKMANTKLAKNMESVLSELDKLRSLNRQHRRLVWQHLTTLAKLEEQPTPGQLKPGPRAFISKFGEETRGFIQSTQDLITADMSLTSRPRRTKAEEFKNLKGMASNICSVAEWCAGVSLLLQASFPSCSFTFERAIPSCFFYFCKSHPILFLYFCKSHPILFLYFCKSHPILFLYFCKNHHPYTS